MFRLYLSITNKHYAELRTGKLLNILYQLYSLIMDDKPSKHV